MKKFLLIFIFQLFLIGNAYAQVAPRWVIDYKNSGIVFEAVQQGASFKGKFTKFEGTINFDSHMLNTSSAVISIDLNSVDTGFADRDDSLKLPDWFDTVQFPWAQFVTTSFEKNTDGSFVAKGNLTIRDKTLPITLPFKLTTATASSGKVIAVMTGDILLNRLDYGVGQGAWGDTNTVGNSVAVSIKITATQN